jgi:hypothetical protein
MCACRIADGNRATSSIEKVECVDCLRAEIAQQAALLRQIARLAEGV